MITEFAPAKINLSLHVTGKRPDFYHTLDSLIVFADIGDEIEIAHAPEFTFQIKGPFAQGLENNSNLAVKAARMMAEKFGKDLNIALTLTKNLPVAAGIGGGSSDAAATLRALQKHWDITEDIADIALKLGADVPVCLKNKPQRVRGIGEKLEPFACPPLNILLINPQKPCSTKDVFVHFKNAFKEEIQIPETVDIAFLKTLDNDLTEAAAQIVPNIKNILEILEQQKKCALTRLSGSGATCFGLFDTPQDAQTAAKAVQKENPDWWIKAGKIL